MESDSTMTEFIKARMRSRSILSALGYKFSESLPLLDSSDIKRNLEAASSRALALYAAVALSYGWDQRRVEVNSWLDRENLRKHLTPVEFDFVSGNVDLIPEMQWRVEALYALAWACKITDQSLLDLVPDELVTWFPNIPKSEPTTDFRRRVELRSASDILLELDLLYCLASAKTDLQLRGKRDKAHPSLDLRSVQQRRHALEWMLFDLDWEEIELDT